MLSNREPSYQSVCACSFRSLVNTFPAGKINIRLCRGFADSRAGVKEDSSDFDGLTPVERMREDVSGDISIRETYKIRSSLARSQGARASKRFFE